MSRQLRRKGRLIGANCILRTDDSKEQNFSNCTLLPNSQSRRLMFRLEKAELMLVRGNEAACNCHEQMSHTY